MYADWLEENGQPERAEYIRHRVRAGRDLQRPRSHPDEWETPRYYELGNGGRNSTTATPRSGSAVGQIAERRDVYPRGSRATSYSAASSSARGAPFAALHRERPLPTSAGTCLIRRTPARAGPQAEFWARISVSGGRPTPAGSPYLGNVRELTCLHRQGDWPAGGRALAGGAFGTPALNLANHEITDDGARKRSARAPYRSQINLTGNNLTDSTLLSLIKATDLKLTALDLSNNSLGGLALTAFSVPHLAGLEHLSLQGNRIGREGVENLVQLPFAARLRELSVAGCGLEDEELAVLLSAAWPQLTTLDIWINDFGPLAAKARRQPSFLMLKT